VLSGSSGSYGDIPGQVRFLAITHVRQKGGTASATDSTITVHGANEATLIISNGHQCSGLPGYFCGPAVVAERNLNKALSKKYPQLLKDHIKAYQASFKPGQAGSGPYRRRRSSHGRSAFRNFNRTGDPQLRPSISSSDVTSSSPARSPARLPPTSRGCGTNNESPWTANTPSTSTRK